MWILERLRQAPAAGERHVNKTRPGAATAKNTGNQHPGTVNSMLEAVYGCASAESDRD